LKLEELKLVDGVSCHAGATPQVLSLLNDSCGVNFPDAYKNLLLLSNGLEVYYGYDRLFGVASSSAIDAISWNKPETWKFAWPDSTADYWCFGESAWGDQFAFFVPELTGQPKVYLLDALTMTPRPVWSSFSEFFDKFKQWAVSGGESQTIGAYKRFGPIETNLNLVFSPPLQISGNEDLANAMKLNAVAAMIVNGDVNTQLNESDDDPIRVETFTDDHGRMRLRLIF
jgi:hypothetical protein